MDKYRLTRHLSHRPPNDSHGQQRPPQTSHPGLRAIPAELPGCSPASQPILPAADGDVPYAELDIDSDAVRGSWGTGQSRTLVPSLQLDSVQDSDVPLRMLASGWLVLYCYPGAPKQDDPESYLEDVRGHEAFAQRAQELRHRAVTVAALSSQSLDQQTEAMLTLGLAHHLLFDPDLALARSLDLSITEIAGQHYYARQTLIICERSIEHIFSPVTDASRSAAQVETWMLAHGW